MPQIPIYNDQVTAQGGVNVRANPDDFGAQVGAATQRLGQAVENVGDAVYKVQEAKDVTNIHANMAKAREDWTKNLLERKAQAQPGDDTFAATLDKDMADFFAKGQASAATSHGKRLYQTLGAQMTSEFVQRAHYLQSELDAEEARGQHEKLNQNLGNVVYADPTQAEAALAQGVAAIDDPKSIYGRVTQSTRNQLKQKFIENVSFSAMRGIIRDNPFAVVGALEGEQMASAYKALLESYKVPGGNLSLSPETLAKAPEIAQAAATHRVAPNVAAAQADKDPSADPKVTASDMGALLKKYGGDYGMALGAYQMGTDAFDRLVAGTGGNWMAAAPPETTDYVNSVLQNAGWSVPAGQPAVQEPTPVTPKVAKPFPGFPLTANLTWQQIDHLAGEAVQVSNMRLGMAARVRDEADRVKKEQQEKLTQSYQQQIFDPKQFGQFKITEVNQDTRLTHQEQAYLIGLYERRLAELDAKAESKTHPDTVRELDRRMHLPVGDPERISSFEDVNKVYWRGGLSFAERGALQNAFQNITDGDMAGWGSRWKQIQSSTLELLKSSIQGRVGGMTGSTITAYNAWQAEANATIAAYRKEGKDIEPLLNPASKEFLGASPRILSFVPSTAQLLESGAEAERAKLPKGRENAKKGEKYIHTDGSIRVRKD